MSFVIFAVLAAGAAGAGWLSGSSVRRRHERKTRLQLDREATDGTESAARSPAFDAYPFAVGDIVARGATEEVLLEGALCMTEDNAPLAMLYFGYAATLRRAVLAFPEPHGHVIWMSPLTLEGAGDLASTVELRGAIFERTRRLPVTIDPYGSTPQGLAGDGMLAEYTSAARGQLAVLRGPSAVVAFEGERVPVGWLEHWSSRETAERSE